MPMRSGNRPVTGIRIISVQGHMEQLWRGATFLMGLNGEIQADVDGHVTFLNKGDVLLIEPCIGFRLSGRGSNLLMLVQIRSTTGRSSATPWRTAAGTTPLCGRC